MSGGHENGEEEDADIEWFHITENLTTVKKCLEKCMKNNDIQGMKKFDNNPTKKPFQVMFQLNL